MFESWGYTIDDSEYLQRLYVSQSVNKYCDGEYEYVGTNGYTAKISITIILTNKNGVEQHVKTIWKLGKRGNVNLITPYSGHIY